MSDGGQGHPRGFQRGAGISAPRPISASLKKYRRAYRFALMLTSVCLTNTEV